MTVRTRLMFITILGLAVTMAVWGWVQLKTLDKILTDHMVKRLGDVAETVGTYYEHFPTRRGLAVLDSALKEQIQTDIRLARIDIYSVVNGHIDYVAGASRVHYDWPETLVGTVAKDFIPRYIKLDTEGGSALGLLYPDMPSEKDKKTKIVIGVISFSKSREEILASARYLLILSSIGLLFFILLVLSMSYGWIIGRPLKSIIYTIDEFQTGEYHKRILPPRRDEWGQLADHFNSMADKIEQILARNRELNLSLEERIQEATRNVIQLQKEVNQLQQLAALGYLTATLAHDLGTPLHSIAGMAKLLLESEDWPPAAGHKLELIVQQTQRLDKVIQNVRRATRLPEPHFETISISELLNETLPLVEPLIQKSGILLRVDVKTDTPLLYLDRYRFQIALLNIIENAVEAVPQEGKIIVSTSVLTDDRLVAVSVRDNGPGIPSELMKRVREPFFSTHTNQGMRGLGLAIVDGIAKEHGGSLEIKSHPDKGTEIILYFPLVDVISDKADPDNGSSLNNP
ncbi:MAG: HAMP domain-containing protein [Proteobacteria bacterium]|nr:HAMP domain-containing protein [Pseudomonadota bacterium]